MIRPTTACLITVVAVWGTLLTPTVHANPIVITDQSSSGGSVIGIYSPTAPFGQEFVPTLSSLDVVELLLSDNQGHGLPPGFFDITVRIREGSIAGAVVGETTEQFPWYYGGGTLGVLTQFDFATPVSLTPGALYVIELESADRLLLRGVIPMCTPSCDNPYAAGRFINGGVPR